jgi:sec-independent protein translocase protein TatA
MFIMNPMLALFNLGGGEIILILALVLILFGARKLPELAKGLGQGIKEFKKATREVTDEVHRSMDDNNSYTPPSPAAPKQVQDSQPEKTAAIPEAAEKKA